MSELKFTSTAIDRLKGCMDDVMQFDADHNIMHENEPTLENLMYNVLALAGEAGEVANEAKKIWRDGATPEGYARLGDEMVDMVIYLVKALKISGIDFDAAWKAKHEELYARWAAKKTHARVSQIG